MTRKPGRPAGRRIRQTATDRTVWLFGLHAVRDALMNPAREKVRLIATANAARNLSDAIAFAGIAPEPADARRFPAPIEPGSVHQGVALQAMPLDWGSLEECCALGGRSARVVLLDRVTDPHNAGAILRSAAVFGACAVIAPARHSAPETGALAKAASGALERQPYLRVRNLANAILALQDMGYAVVGLDGGAEQTVEDALYGRRNRLIALVLGAEGVGLRVRTREVCDTLARIAYPGGFGSLNVSNAAAVALYAGRPD